MTKMTTTKTMYVIFVGGRIARTNDENPSPMLFASRRHAARVIRWLGLTLTRIAEATEEQIAEGDFCEAKSDDE
jgi:hypothetical protein